MACLAGVPPSRVRFHGSARTPGLPAQFTQGEYRVHPHTLRESHEDAHGSGAESGLIHSVVCTSANEADVAHGHKLLHSQEGQVHGDSGYTGLNKRPDQGHA